MPIRPSSAADIGRLIDELSSGDALRRETAAARLAVIGARAFGRLAEVASNPAAEASSRVAALQALEAMGSPRGLSVALPLAAEPQGIGEAAIAVIGAVARSRDPRAARAFDWLAALVLDPSAGESRRLAALSALEGVAPRQMKPIYDALAADPNSRLAARITRRRAGQTLPLERAVGGRLPDDPAVVSAMLREEAETAGVTALRRLIELVHDREREAGRSTRAAWVAVRGQVHQALAARRSRLGLYDVREALEGAEEPLPVGFLAAAAAVGDATCLDALAAAWVRSRADQRWWREHLAEAFRAIVGRERLTRRHPALKRILEKRPAAAVLVAEARR